MDVGGEDERGCSKNARGFSADALLPGFRVRDNQAFQGFQISLPNSIPNSDKWLPLLSTMWIRGKVHACFFQNLFAVHRIVTSLHAKVTVTAWIQKV